MLYTVITRETFQIKHVFHAMYSYAFKGKAEPQIMRTETVIFNAGKLEGKC